MVINLLPEEIVNQIAAGEVIENPSAVIKELVENSIDAGATNIEIEIEDTGLKRITIKDNGCGISKEDLLKAPLRHATSKIQSFNDLYNIKTMGFRGEALASIFSVAKTSIISQQKDQAYEISSEDTTQIKESAGQKGTTIHVHNIFYNTPARKKYLKSDNLELKAILDVVNRFELIHFDKKISLKHNNKILINKPTFKTQQDNIYYVLGKELKDNLLEINEQTQGIKITGFIGKPSNITYSFRKNHYLYVNERFVKSKLLRDAIYEGFGTNLMEARHPMFCLFIEIDPEIIDVNVHPTKIEIKFENELEIYEFTRGAIQKAFQINETFKPFETKPVETDISLDKSIDEIVGTQTSKQKIEPKSYFTKDEQKHLKVNEPILPIQKSYDFQDETIEKRTQEIEPTQYGPLYDILKDYRIVGQINKTFIILETPKEMIVVDQHVAEEKFFYETFKSHIESKISKSQTLLKPHMLSLSKQEMLLFKENLDLIKKLGFQTEEFGGTEVLVRAVPIGIKGVLVEPQTLKDIINEITIDRKFKQLEESKIDKLASMACKRSIKAGHEMTTPEIHTMIENLKKLKEPFNCPHGRPILLQWTFTDLEKKFKRIV